MRLNRSFSWALLCLAAAAGPPSDNGMAAMAFVLSPPSQHTIKPFSPSVHLRKFSLKRFCAHSDRRQVQLCAVSVDNDATSAVVSCMEQVHQLVQRNDTAPLRVQGTIIATRLFGPSFGFIDVQVTNDNTDNHVVQLMVKRQEYHGDLGGLLEALSLGMLIHITGTASVTRNLGEGVVLVRSCEIRGLPPNPQHVRKLLRLIYEDKLNANQLESAVHMTSDELTECIRVASKGTGDFTMLAKKLLLESSTTKQSSTSVVDAASDSNDRSFPPVPEQLQTPPLSIKEHMDSSDEIVMMNSVSDLYRQRRDTKELEGKRPVSRVRLQAWVQNRRRFCDSVTVVKVSDSFMAATTNGEVDVSFNETTRCSCILHPDLLRDDDEEAANADGNLLCAGSRVLLEGYVVHEEETGTPTVWATNVQLLRCSWRPMVIRYLIELLVRDEFDMEEAADALKIDLLQAEQLSQLDLTERQWKANEFSRTLQDSQSRMASVSEEMMQVLASFEGLRRTFPKQIEDESPSETTSNLLATNREGTWWQRKKRPQLEFMGRQVQNVVQSHPEFGKRTLRILDVGGGKGVLAHYLAQLLGNAVQVQVIDIARSAIQNGLMRSKRLALASPVEFVVGDASQFEHDMDIVVALHACGSLSDVALGHAVNHGAGFVICPCCFRSNPHLYVPIRQHDEGIRQFQLPHEWLDVDANDLDIIKRISEVQGDEHLASEGMHTLCAIRAEAVQRQSEKRTDNGNDLGVTVKTFPVSYSTRNFCLVGTVQRRHG